MDPAAALRLHRKDILAIAARHGVRDVRVFGSVARGTSRPDSDLDLLVHPGPDTTLLDLIAMEQDLEDLLGVRVQVVSDGGLKPWARDAILNEAVPV